MAARASRAEEFIANNVPDERRRQQRISVRITLPISRTPIQRISRMLLFGRFGIARLASEIIKSARQQCTGRASLRRTARTSTLGLFGDAIHRDDHVVEGDARIASHQRPEWLPARFALSIADATVARRQVDVGVEASLQERLDVNQVDALNRSPARPQ